MLINNERYWRKELDIGIDIGEMYLFDCVVHFFVKLQACNHRMELLLSALFREYHVYE